VRTAVRGAVHDPQERDGDDPVEGLHVVVADAPGLFRTAVCTLLRRSGFVVEEASDVAEARRAAAGRDGLVLLDLDLAGGGAFTALASLLELQPRPFVVVWAADPPGRAVLAALKAGANGFLDQSIPPEEFVAALRATRSGKPVLCGTAAARLVRALQVGSEDRRQRDLAFALSPRERDVMQLLTHGERNYEIARALAIAEPTVKRHVHNILAKTGAPSRRAAVALYTAGSAS